MTGEMSWITANGQTADGTVYNVHAAVAKALHCELRPFDVYAGPYIAHAKGKLWISSDGGAGEVCLWPNGIAPAYQKPIVTSYFPADDVHAAIKAAQRVLRKSWR